MHDPWSPVYIVVGTAGKRHVDYLDPNTGITRRTHLKFVKPVLQRTVRFSVYRSVDVFVVVLLFIGGGNVNP